MGSSRRLGWIDDGVVVVTDFKVPGRDFDLCTVDPPRRERPLLAA